MHSGSTDSFFEAQESIPYTMGFGIWIKLYHHKKNQHTCGGGRTLA